MSAAHEVSLAEARRLALAAQGFGPKPAKPTVAHIRRLASRICSFQIDSINVLVRAHYLPAYSRLGPYPMRAIDSLAYERRELFEWWSRAACFLPIGMHRLFRYRMSMAKDWIAVSPKGEALDSTYVEKVYAEVAERGPITAAELLEGGKRGGKWWGWSAGKTALEYLFSAGQVAVAGRRNFTRVYDVAERVLPREILEAPAPDADESRKELLCLAATAQGVATASELIWYFGIDQPRERRKGPHGKAPKPVGRRLIAELVDEGRLAPVKVEDWTAPAYMHPGAKPPRSMNVRALLGCFDTLLWRDTQQLFGFSQPLAQQLYVPAAKRKYGYYVLPFLLHEAIVARCDLKADRVRKVLMVQSAFLEPGHQARRVVPELVDELRQMQSWLELDRIEVGDRGDLAQQLRRALK